MIVIAMISQKGGSGKTTLALALTSTHEEAGGVAVVADLDPQGSASAWYRFRSVAPPLVQAVHAPRPSRAVEAFRQPDGGQGGGGRARSLRPRSAAGVTERREGCWRARKISERER